MNWEHEVSLGAESNQKGGLSLTTSTQLLLRTRVPVSTRSHSIRHHLTLLLTLEVAQFPALLSLRHAGSISHGGGYTRRCGCRKLVCSGRSCSGLFVVVGRSALESLLCLGVDIVRAA